MNRESSEKYKEYGEHGECRGSQRAVEKCEGARERAGVLEKHEETMVALKKSAEEIGAFRGCHAWRGRVWNGVGVHGRLRAVGRV